MASARMSRPSASVLPISMDLPAMEPITSPGRKLSGEIRFSTAGITAVTFTGTWFFARASMAPATAAPPAMSHFMVRIPWAVFRE